MFARAEKKLINIYQFLLWIDQTIKKVIIYIRIRPFAIGLVTDPIHYKYSNAMKYYDYNTVLKINDPGFMG